ncbi:MULTISPECIES: hypothetical protein [unclassified Pseudomonas]|uniref:hypothetical protein n=1 Tax=unclassified Pseudomonas TaxID=196821 RepID=UPI00235E9969|nr:MULTISPECIES: hypothetical protein [unclassified Pseudomonas]
MIGIYFEKHNLKEAGLWLNFNDAIQAVGQLGTLGAFIVAIHQVLVSKREAAAAQLKERQAFFAQECRTQVGKMTETIRTENVKFREITDLFDFVSTMANLGGNLHRYYSQLLPSDQRELVDGDWQDMFYNDLIPFLQGISLLSLIRDGIPSPTVQEAKEHAWKEVNIKRYMDVFRRFFFSKIVLTKLRPNIRLGILSHIQEDISSLYLFKHYYFEEEMVKDYLVGTMAILDFRVSAPALAALYEEFGSHYECHD